MVHFGVLTQILACAWWVGLGLVVVQSSRQQTLCLRCAGTHHVTPVMQVLQEEGGNGPSNDYSKPTRAHCGRRRTTTRKGQRGPKAPDICDPYPPKSLNQAMFIREGGGYFGQDPPT